MSQPLEQPGSRAPEGARPGEPGVLPLPDLPERLLAGYLDAALEVLRATPPAKLPAALRQYQSWTPQRLRHPRVLALVKRSLEVDAGFRDAVHQQILAREAALARLVRAGRHGEALASGEPAEAVVRVGLALGAEGRAAVHAAAAAAEAEQARAEAARAAAAHAEAASELAAARARLEAEAAAARAAREEARAAREELRRAERRIQALTERSEALERELAEARAALAAARDAAAQEQRRLVGRLRESQVRLAEAQRQYRELRRSAGRVDPMLVEAVEALERDLAALRRAAGLATAPARAGGTPVVPRRPERRAPLPVPPGRDGDDPETLLAWLGQPRVLALVDGYNVTKHERGFPEHSLEDQRTLLLDLCRRVARRTGAELTVVFDGAELDPLPARVQLGGVGVVFTDPGVTADDEIVARVNAAPAGRPVVVVSSDNGLRERAAALGASVIRSTALLGVSR